MTTAFSPHDCAEPDSTLCIAPRCAALHRRQRGQRSIRRIGRPAGKGLHDAVDGAVLALGQLGEQIEDRVGLGRGLPPCDLTESPDSVQSSELVFAAAGDSRQRFQGLQASCREGKLRLLPHAAIGMGQQFH